MLEDQFTVYRFWGQKKREETVAVYKEVMGLAEHMGQNAFNLQLSKNDDPTEGYRIHIEMETDGII